MTDSDILAMLREQRRKSGARGCATALVVSIVTIGCVIALWVGSSYMEARTYNRLTGADLSTLDAMFIQLRVQDAPRKGD